MEYDQEIEEKIRLNNEIKKFSGQILNSEKVAHFMKKYDQSRESMTNSEVKNRKTYTMERMSKRLDNVGEFVEKLKLGPNKTSMQNVTDQSDLE